MSAKNPAWGLLPSLIVLGAVFYFINSACLSGDDDEASSCPAPVTPSGATLSFLEPVDSAVISRPGEGGLVEVEYRLQATGVTVSPDFTCQPGTGQFLIVANPVAGRAGAALRDTCPQQRSQITGLQGKLQLPPGKYELQASFVDSESSVYQPELTATVSVTVARETNAAGSSPCGP